MQEGKQIAKVSAASLAAGLGFFSMVRLIEVPIWAFDNSIKPPDRKFDFIFSLSLIGIASLSLVTCCASCCRRPLQDPFISLVNDFSWKINALITGLASSAVLYGLYQAIQTGIVFGKDIEITPKQNFINTMVYLALSIPIFIIFAAGYFYRCQQAIEQAQPLNPSVTSESYGSAL